MHHLVRSLCVVAIAGARTLQGCGKSPPVSSDRGPYDGTDARATSTPALSPEDHAGSRALDRVLVANAAPAQYPTEDPPVACGDAPRFRSERANPGARCLGATSRSIARPRDLYARRSGRVCAYASAGGVGTGIGATLRRKRNWCPKSRPRGFVSFIVQQRKERTL